MKKLIAILVAGLLLFSIPVTAQSADAIEKGSFSLTTGGSLQLLEEGDPGWAFDINGLYFITDKVIIEGGYGASGDGDEFSHARLGLHGVIYSFKAQSDSTTPPSITLGVGGLVQGFGVENSDLGFFGAVGILTPIPALGDMLFEYEGQWRIDEIALQKYKPVGKVKVCKVITF